MTGTWQRLMLAWAWGVVGFGAVLMGGAFAATDGATRALLALLGGAAPMMDASLRFSVGLMGAVTVGWGLTVHAAASVSQLLEHGVARSLWRRITLAVIAWYIVDSLISVATGFALNALSNTVLVAAYLVIAWGAKLFGGTDFAARTAPARQS